MAKGLSIHIGLNSVDPNHYFDQHGRPWPGTLVACESDARSFEAIAGQQGFAPKVLLTDQATSDAVIAAIEGAALDLEAGDVLFLTYSGHGGQVPDRNDETRDETDDMDETWCLYDRQLVDDELYALWCRFKPGVRILMLSDSCHSGTVARDIEEKTKEGPQAAMRVLPQEVQVGTYKAHRDLYDGIQAALPAGETGEVGASIVLISGCQDNQVSYDGKVNGLFTEKVLKTWNGGRYKGGLARFYREVVRRMPLYQSPNYFKVGKSDPAFERMRPFTV